VTGIGVTPRMVCAGCGYTAPTDEPYPFRCPNAGTDDTDHVLSRVLDAGGMRWADLVDEDDPNPFVRYRRLFHSWYLAAAHGMSDDDYVDLVRRLDKEVASVDGHGFEVTPFGRADGLSSRLGFAGEGGVWVKDETGNVSGSHKARHMMGLLIHLEVVERLGLAPQGERRDLAIASCGNAALAAAAVARAGQRTLQVFVPTWGDPKVVARLEELGATVNRVARVEGVAGDPTYHALQKAIAAGALPFTCQGNENGLVIEGGNTLGYEMASQLAEGREALNRVFVQVGGGALASAVIQGLREAVDLDAVMRMPRVHTVQTDGGYPLKRAYDLMAERLAAHATDSSRYGAIGMAPYAPEKGPRDADQAASARAAVGEALDYARTHRHEFMWPWEEEPKSIAHGILDDETYDWLAVVRGLLETEGWPVTVGENTLEEANQLARETTGIDVDHTGSSGFAGLVELRKEREVGDGEKVAVLFTGVRR
jgi:threonine synthase